MWKQINDNCYTSSDGETIDGETIKREYWISFRWIWVYRNVNGKYIDSDRYRHDLFERNNIKIEKEIITWQKRED